jgi:hypothetical protein
MVAWGLALTLEEALPGFSIIAPGVLGGASTARELSK